MDTLITHFGVTFIDAQGNLQWTRASTLQTAEMAIAVTGVTETQDPHSSDPKLVWTTRGPWRKP